MKPIKETGPLWTVVDADGHIWHWTASDTRRGAIAGVMEETPFVDGTTWAKLQRKGWRCIKVRLVPVEER